MYRVKTFRHNFLFNQRFYFKQLLVLLLICTSVAAFAGLFGKQGANPIQFAIKKNFFDKKTEKLSIISVLTDSIVQLNAEDITTSQATLSWAKSISAKKYTVTLYSEGLKVKSINTSSNRTIVTGLKAGTKYDWIVTEAINNISSSIASFTTMSGVQAIEGEELIGYAAVIITPGPEEPGGNGCTTTKDWVLDKDKDGYFTGNIYRQCNAPSNEYVEYETTMQEGDCRDDIAAINPGATEICDGIDNDCDGIIDGPSAILNTFYLDFDQDGFGSSATSIESCETPLGYVQNDDDCNDGEASINPGANEIFDGVDNNCDGNIDEGFNTSLTPLPTSLTTGMPGFQDYIIPADITSVSLDVQGAKGGSLRLFNSRENSELSAGEGGRGRMVNAKFTVDADCQQALKPGGILRLLIGSTPANVILTAQPFPFPKPQNIGQGGGGGSAILYQAPGSTEWEVLVVAGGGGGAGAIFSGTSTTPKNGLPGIEQTSDANTGPNTLGGKSSYVSTTVKDPFDPRGSGTITTYTINSGGGGGMLGDGKAVIFENNGTTNEIGECGGGKGLDADADGGVSSVCTNGKTGGLGFGAGGSGIYGGGGGGGYSGGNGGTVANGGYGAGSFTSSNAELISSQTGANVVNGKITISTSTTATIMRYYPDEDRDGFGTGDGEIFCTNPGDGYATEGGDCDDEDANITTPQTWVLDNDNDGYYVGEQINSCSSPGDGYRLKVNQQPGDCNDYNYYINPGVPEIDCDGIDNNCDYDEGGWPCVECTSETAYRDVDGDGFGDPNIFIENYWCGPDFGGYVANNLDCDDSNAEINPETVWVLDFDEDGYYIGELINACSSPGQGYRIKVNQQPGDCDDEDAEVTLATTWFLDEDKDGYAASTIISCTSPGEFYTNNNLPLGDCDDSYFEINPTTVWYEDRDNDGYPSTRTMIGCQRPQFYYGGIFSNTFTDGKLASELISLILDCDDTEASISPGTTWYKDGDNDGFSDGTTLSACFRPSGYKLISELLSTGGDCNDGNPGINPGAIEICDNIDNNCNGLVNEGFPDADSDGISDCIDPDDDGDNITDQADCAPLDPTKWRTGTFYVDADNDNLGIGSGVTLCYGNNTPVGYATNADDCDDEIKYNTSLQLHCPPNETFSGCDISSLETQTGLAYATNITSITEQQFIAVNGSIVHGTCAVASIAYQDTEDPASTDFKKIINRKFTVTDVRNGLFNCIQIIIVEDNVPPTVITKNFAVKLDATGQAFIAIADINNGSTDNCGIATYSLSNTSFDCANIGANSVTLTVTDVNSNTASATATVTVVDNTDPTVITQPVTIYLDATGAATVTAAQVNNGSTDNCSIASYSLDKTDFDCSDVGPNTVTLTVMDVNGNDASATATVTVVDNTDPTVAAQPVTIYLDATGAATVTAAQVNNGSTDNCSIGSYSLDKTDFDCSDVGPNTVTLTVMDVNVNDASATATVTVVDNTDPTVATQAVTIYLDATGAATVTAAQVNNGSTDNCSIASYSLDKTDFDCNDVGPNTVTLTVMDMNGNDASATATVTVIDNTDPTVATQPVTIYLDATGAATVTAAQVNNGSIDNCSIAGYSLDKTDFDCSDVGPNTVTLTVMDVNGNDASATATVTVVDNTDPVLAIPVSLTISCTESVLPANTGEATATDNCDPEPLVTYSDLSTQGTNAANCNYYNYKITRTWNALDAAGNSSSLEQIIDVADITKPEITCVVQPEGGFKRSTDAGLCTYKVQGTEFDATATDNCATPVITWSVTGATSISGNNSMANAELNFGVNTITWTATDPCGNVASCEIIVDVNKVITTTNVTVTPDEIQYSDKVTFTATVTPYNCAGAENIGGKVTFKIGSLVMGEANVVNGVATLNDVPVLEDMLYDANLNDPLNATAGPLKPGSKTITALFSGTDADYQVNDPTASLNITCEDAEVVNTGQQYFTVNPNSNTGTVVLSAFVADINDVPTGTRGDIRNATLTFKDGGSSGSVIGTPNIPAGLIDPGVTTEGIASTDINYTLTNSDISNGGKIFEVWTGADNYYCGETGGELTNVTIALPGQEFVTGGGHIIMQNSTGKYAGKAGKKMNFGLVMKWNKSGKNLQGKVNIIYRAEVNGVTKIYQIKSNAISSLAVLDVNDNGVSAKGNAITFRKAIIVTKANLTDVTNPLAPISLGGGYSFEVTAWESTTNTTGALDRISVQLMGSGSEGLLFSSKWTGSSTVWQTLNGGKMQVRSTTTTLPAPITQKGIEEFTETSMFDLKGYPNPSSSTFNIHVQSSDDKERILLRVIDISGRTVQKIENIKAGQILNIGATYRPGMYFVEMVQGNNRKQLKLIKQAD